MDQDDDPALAETQSPAPNYDASTRYLNWSISGWTGGNALLAASTVILPSAPRDSDWLKFRTVV